MPLPNFLIIGAAKSGTTSLFNYLAQHPDVFMSPVKEPNYFALCEGPINLRGPVDEASMFRLMHRKSVTRLDAYEALFAHAAGHKAIGEASPRYLYAPQAPAAIARRLGALRLIAILRDPAERAYSHFVMNRHRGVEPCASFADALAAEDERVADGWDWDWHYVRLGRYAAQLERYLDHFDRVQVRICLYDDLRRDPQRLLQDLFDFLGIEASFVADVSTRHKAALSASDDRFTRLAFAPENTWLGRLAYRVVPSPVGRAAQDLLQTLAGRLPGAAVPPMTAEVRQRLVAQLSEDTLRLERLIERDLSAWRRP